MNMIDINLKTVLKGLSMKLTKSELRRLEECKKSGFDIWKGRKATPSSEVFYHWCMANNKPHILIKYRRKFVSISMDLPDASGWPGRDSIYKIEFCELCQKHGVEWTGVFSVLDLPTDKIKSFSKEILDIGLAFCAKRARETILKLQPNGRQPIS